MTRTPTRKWRARVAVPSEVIKAGRMMDVLTLEAPWDALPGTATVTKIKVPTRPDRRWLPAVDGQVEMLVEGTAQQVVLSQ